VLALREIILVDLKAGKQDIENLSCRFNGFDVDLDQLHRDFQNRNTLV
jgi:hypothetical protein